MGDVGDIIVRGGNPLDPTFGQGTAADIEVFQLQCSPAELDAFCVEAFVAHLGAVWVNPDAAQLVAHSRAA